MAELKIAEDSSWWCCGECRPWFCADCREWHCDWFEEKCRKTGQRNEERRGQRARQSGGL